MKQRIYIDTSVFGGNFDEEFAEHTIPLFERLKNNEFTLLYSSVTQDELTTAPQKVKELVKSIKRNMLNKRQRLVGCQRFYPFVIY